MWLLLAKWCNGTHKTRKCCHFSKYKSQENEVGTYLIKNYVYKSNFFHHLSIDIGLRLSIYN